jgi:hypothetical protein
MVVLWCAKASERTMTDFMPKFKVAINLVLSGREKNWAISILLLLIPVAAIAWLLGFPLLPIIVGGLAASFNMIASSVNSAWHGGKLNEVTKFVSAPKIHFWSYLFTEMAISLIFISAIMYQFSDQFVLYLLYMSVILTHIIHHIWKFHDQIFAKTSDN